MAHFRHISITVRREPDARCGTSLAWIAPELRHAGLRLVEDHLDDGRPTRTWAGAVDEGTFRRFARAWRLPRDDEELRADRAADRNETVGYTRTFDGMNWEVDGVSPIISVSVEVTRRTRVLPTGAPDLSCERSRARATSVRLDA
jgi:hypothetical protein